MGAGCAVFEELSAGAGQANDTHISAVRSAAELPFFGHAIGDSALSAAVTGRPAGAPASLASYCLIAGGAGRPGSPVPCTRP